MNKILIALMLISCAGENGNGPTPTTYELPDNLTYSCNILKVKDSYTDLEYLQLDCGDGGSGLLKSGDIGPQGYKGDKGDKGDRGDKGNDGYSGYSCWDVNKDHLCDELLEDKDNDGVCTILDCQGVPGPQGLVGISGPQGLMGPQGMGLQGAQGIRGPQGLIGDKGNSGDTGPQGIQGVIGPVGIDGAVGLKGDMGNVGPQGIQGVQGVMGASGDRGLAGGSVSQFCGISEETSTGGNYGGWSGVGDICRRTCDSPTAHMCSASEIHYTWQQGDGTEIFEMGWISGTNTDGLNMSDHIGRMGWDITSTYSYEECMAKINNNSTCYGVSGWYHINNTRIPFSNCRGWSGDISVGMVVQKFRAEHAGKTQFRSCQQSREDPLPIYCCN